MFIPIDRYIELPLNVDLDGELPLNVDLDGMTILIHFPNGKPLKRTMFEPGCGEFYVEPA